MTTPNIEELITYLRSFFIDENVSAIKANQIANALQSQAERIKVIERESEMRRIALHEVMLESDQLRAQLAEIEATEPYAYTHNHEWKLRQSELVIKMVKSFQPEYGFTFPLFTRPMPAESKDAERYRWLRDYLISPSTHFDDLIVSADKADTLNGVIDAARAKGTK